jgi:hypothetical protein
MSAVLASSESPRDIPAVGADQSWTPQRTLRVAEPQGRRPFNWSLLWAWVLYILWQLLTKIALSSIYLTLIADGLQQFIPTLAQRIYKAFPALSALQDYEAWHRVTLAQPAALILMVFVWLAWGRVLKTWASADDDVRLHDGTPKRQSDIFVVLAVVLLVGDCCLLYFSLVRVGWGGAAFSLSALIGTAVYAAVLVFAVLQSMSLKRQCVRLKNPEN